MARWILSGFIFCCLSISSLIAQAATISGQVTDEVYLHPIPDVSVTMLDMDGLFLGDSNTDTQGNYYLTGLPNGDYVLIADTVPNGYTEEIYGGALCPGSSCNIVDSAVVITVTDADEPNRDFALNYSGTRVFGTVTRADNSQPVSSQVQWLHVALYDQDGNDAGVWNTNNAGQYFFEVAPGTYRLQTHHVRSYHGLIDEAWDDHPCDVPYGCATTDGDLLTVTANNTTIANLVLDAGATISGNVSGGGNPLNNVEVCVARRDGGWLTCNQTDSNGDYTVIGLPFEDDLIPYISDVSGQPFLLQTYDGKPPHDWNGADGVDVSVSNEINIDFILVQGTLVSGVLLSELDGPVTVGAITAYLPDGSNGVSGFTDGSGNWSMLLAPGDYHFYFEAWDTFDAYIDEFQNETPCLEQNCGDWANQLTPLTVTSAPLVLNNTLNRGFIISGTVKDEGDNPIPTAYLDFFDQNGHWVEGTGVDPDSGYWSIPVASPGDYYTYTTNWSVDGFAPEIWNDRACPLCDPIEVGDPITVVDTDVGGIDFVLETGYQISGIVNGMQPGEGYVAIVNENGQVIQKADINGDGTWNSLPLPGGFYRAYSWGEDWGYATELYNSGGNQPCYFATCDLFAPGTAIEINGSDVGSIVFNMVPYSNDWTVSGHIWDGEGNPGPGGLFVLFNAIGQELDSWWVEGDGSFETYPLPDGVYYGTTRYTEQALDEAWDNVPCVNRMCDPASTTPIMISGGNVTEIDFYLDPISSSGSIFGRVEGAIGNPLPDVEVAIYNANGEFLRDWTTDQDGNYRTYMFADGTFYVAIQDVPLPLGYARELYDGYQCIPAHICDDPSIVTSGTPVIIAGSDQGGINFDLQQPPGFTISGQVTDEVYGHPIPGVSVTMLDMDGEFLGDSNTDTQGNYYLTGLPNGDYVLIADTVPDGYTEEVHGGALCPGSSCDIVGSAVVITISGADQLNRDFALNYSGTRIFGTVTRADNGEPVSSQVQWLHVALYDQDGNDAGVWNTNNAGQYFFEVAPGTYRLQTHHVREYHGLIDEAWDDHPCDVPYGCAPTDGDLLTVTANNTTIANLVLDAGATISGNVSGSGNPLNNIEVCVARRDGGWLTCNQTDSNGDYAVIGLPFEDDLIPYVNYVNGQPFLLQTYDGKPPHDWNNADGVNVSVSNAINIDFDLQPGTLVQGTLLTSDGDPVTEGAVTAFRASDGAWITSSGMDENGYWVLAVPPDTDYYFLFEAWGSFDAWLDEYSDGAGNELSCLDNDCEWFNVATPLYINGGPVTLDNQLERGYWRIRGHILDHNGEPGPGGAVAIEDTDGNWWGHGWTEPDGSFESEPLPNGDYHLWTQYTGEAVDARWDGGPEDQCPNQLCDVLGGDLVGVYNGDAEGIDFWLEPIPAGEGGHISGNVSALLPPDAPLPPPTALANMTVVIFNQNGNYLFELGTDSNGDYQTHRLLNDDYFVTTAYEPFGLGRELWAGRFGSEPADPFDDENVVCLPPYQCDDPGFITGNGGAVTIFGTSDNGDVSGVDFVLQRPPGYAISGQVTDSVDGFPLAYAWVTLYDESGGWQGETRTDKYGDYYFSGLPDLSNYKVYVEGPPGDYIAEMYGAVCGWDCDPAVDGGVITINGDNQIDQDIALTYTGGARIVAIVTDSSGEPLSERHGQMLVSLYNNARDWIDNGGTSDAGQREFRVDPDTYYLDVRADPQLHNVINEVHDDIHCYDSCYPSDFPGATPIPVGADETVVVYFSLETASTISGTVTASGGGALANIQVCAQNPVYWAHCAWTDGSGYYQIRGLEERSDWEVLVNNTSGQPYQTQNYDNNPVDNSSGSANGIDFALEATYTISGTLREAVTNNLVEGLLVCIGRTDNSLVSQSCRRTDVNGEYSVSGLSAGTDYVPFVLGRDSPYRSQMWDGMDCPWNWCQLDSGTPLAVGNPGDATSTDFVLQPNTLISGTIYLDDPGGPIPHDYARARLYREVDKAQVATIDTDENGDWYFGSVVPGDYYVVSTPRFGNVIDEVFDDVPCPRLSCDLPQPGAQILSLATGDRFEDVDAILSEGSRITGWLNIVGSGPLQYGGVFIYDADGDYAGFGNADENGYWESGSGLPAGNYYVTTRWENNPSQNAEYFPMAYPNRPCGDPCDATLGDLITVDGDNDVNDINFDLVENGGGTLVLLSGQVTDNLSNPLQNIQIDVQDADSNDIGYGVTGANGSWVVAAPATGVYYANTADWSTGNFIPEAWDDVICNGCDAVASGSQIVVSGEDYPGIDFQLFPGHRLSGIVTDEFDASPLENITVCAANLTDFSWIGCRATNASGYYEFSGVSPRDDIVPFTWETNGQLYVPEVYNSRICCQYWLGDPVTALLSGDVTVDFALARSSSLSGNVTDSLLLNGVAGVEMQLYDQQCTQVASAQTGESGDYTITGFTEGIYHVFADGGSLGYIRELYPNLKRYFACNPEISESVPIAIGAEEALLGINMDLDSGAIISGTISGPGGVLSRNQGQARMYAADGEQLLVQNNQEPDNSYLLGGVLPGTYYVVLSSRNQGLVDELFNNVQCPRFSCGPGPGVPIVVGPGDIATEIDATLAPGSTISGHLSDASTSQSLAGFEVYIYTETGEYAAFGFTDENGDWQSYTALPAGNYIASNQYRLTDQFDPVLGGYLPMVWPNRTCGEPCDFLQGDLISVDGTPAGSVDGIDFAMETGATINGQVTTAGATPLANVTVQLLSSADGSIIRSVISDAGGNYEIAGVGSGDYFLRTSNVQGYSDQLHSGISCNPFCAPLTGTALTVLPADEALGPFNFDLSLTPFISGVVRDHNNTPVGGVTVNAFDTLGGLVATTTSDAQGEYTIVNLYAGSFFITTANSAGYVNALYENGVCLPGCDPTSGTAVAVSSGASATEIDLALGSASILSGNVNDGAEPIAGVTIQVYLDTGAFVSSTLSNAGGEYSIDGLAAGNYHAVTRNTFGYIDEGAGGEICQSGCPPTSTIIVPVGLNTNVGLDFSIDAGGQITGQVIDTALSELQSVTVLAYNVAGDQIGTSTTDPFGNFTIGGLAGGNVYLRTSNALGYRDQRYDDLDCDALCDVLAATPVAVTIGDTVPDVDFTLALGGSIAGTVSTTLAVPISGVQVQVFDDAGLLAGFTSTTGDGNYLVSGLDDGDYRIKSINPAGYVDQVRGGDSCSPEPCNLFSGDVTTVASSNETGVDFTLSLGDQIAGIATDGMGVPLPTGTADVYSASGQLLKQGGIFGGSFLVNGLANGTYYMLVTNGSGLVDQLWQDLPCPGGSCDVTSGLPIVLGGAAVQSVSSPQSTADRLTRIKAVGSGTRLSFELDRGTVFLGSVRDENNNAIQFAQVYFFDADGDVAGQATTDGLGNFVSSSSFPAGIYYAATSAPGMGGVGTGLIDEIFGGVPCAGECDLSTPAGTAIEVPGVHTDQIHFVLGSGKTISGLVSVAESGLPLPVATISLFAAAGAPAGTTQSDGLGHFEFDGLLPGSYFALASHPSGTYTSVLFSGIDCTAGCDATTGTAIALAGLDIDTIDFALSDGSCPFQADPEQPDSDKDGVVDACEVNPPVIDSSVNVPDSSIVGDGTVLKKGVILGEHVEVGVDGLIDRIVNVGNGCTIGDRVLIGKDSRLGERCHIGDDSVVGADVVLDDDVYLGTNVNIGRGVTIEGLVFIGNDVSVGRGATIISSDSDIGIEICDGARIKKGKVISSWKKCSP